MIDFQHSGYLILLALIPLYLLLAGWQRSRRKQALVNLFPGSRPTGKISGPGSELILFAAGGIFLILALAGPVRFRKHKVLKRRGLALAVAVDVSKSMLAEDVPAPYRNRIDRARGFVLDLLEGLEGESIGVAVFAAEGLELVPLTRDYGYCRYLVENLDTMAVSAPGSSLAAGLESGKNLLLSGSETEDSGSGNLKPGKPAAKKSTGVIILVSDGEDLGRDPGRAGQLAGNLHREGRAVYAIGIGRRQPSLIPIRTPDGREIIDYYRDAENNFLTTSRQDNPLEELAAAGGGRFLLLKQGQNTVATLLQQVLQQAETSGRGLVVENRPQSLAPGCLVAAFLCFAAALAGREISA